MSMLCEQFRQALWATKRAFRDSCDVFGQRFGYWWGLRDDRQMIDKVDSWHL